jgi:hypothetical protein
MELVEVGRFDLILYTLELEHQGLGNIILDPVAKTGKPYCVLAWLTPGRFFFAIGVF